MVEVAGSGLGGAREISAKKRMFVWPCIWDLAGTDTPPASLKLFLLSFHTQWSIRCRLGKAGVVRVLQLLKDGIAHRCLHTIQACPDAS